MFKSIKSNSVWVPVWQIYWEWHAIAEKSIIENWSITYYYKDFVEFNLSQSIPVWNNVVNP